MASACCVASMSSWDGHFDACRPRSIFSHARVAGENDETPFAAPAAKLCEAFLTVGSGEPLFVFYLSRFVIPIQWFYRFNISGDPCVLHGSPLLCSFLTFHAAGVKGRLMSMRPKVTSDAPPTSSCTASMPSTEQREFTSDRTISCCPARSSGSSERSDWGRLR